MSKTETNVVKVDFGGRPYPEIGDLVKDLYDCINEYAGLIPHAAAIGALRIVEQGLLNKVREAS